jgi:hypothetical protein
MMRSHADSHAAPVVGTTSDLQCASAGLRCCTFQVAGARAARVWLTCRCLSAVPQVCTPCSAAPPRGPIVHPRARAMRLHVFSGRSVQRWPRTRRSSDPLQMRASGPYFRPKAQIHHRELESGVGMRVRSRPDASAAPAAPSSATTPRPCMRGSAHLARQAGCALLQLDRLVVLFCNSWCPPTHRSIVGCSRSWRARRFNRSASISASSCSPRYLLLLLRILRRRRVLTSSCLVLRVCAFSATVPAPLSSDGNSNIHASSSSAPASLLRASTCSRLSFASPAACCIASSLAPCMHQRCYSSTIHVRLFYPPSSSRGDLSQSSSDHLGARIASAPILQVAPSDQRPSS